MADKMSLSIIKTPSQVIYRSHVCIPFVQA